MWDIVVVAFGVFEYWVGVLTLLLAYFIVIVLVWIWGRVRDLSASLEKKLVVWDLE